MKEFAKLFTSIVCIIGTSPSSPGALSSVTLVGSPNKTSPVEPAKTEKKSPTKDNDTAAAIMKVESIELVDQSDEDIKYKEEEPEKNKHKIDDKFKISQRFSEVCNVNTISFILKHIVINFTSMSPIFFILM